MTLSHPLAFPSRGAIMIERISELLVRFFSKTMQEAEREELRNLFSLIAREMDTIESRSQRSLVADFLGIEAERLGISIALLRTLSAVETRLHRSRLIRDLSDSLEIEEVSGDTPRTIEWLLRALPRDEKLYRAAQLQTHSPYTRAEVVACEIAAEHERACSTRNMGLYSSDRALAQRLEVPLVVVHHSARELIDPSVRSVRRAALVIRGPHEEAWACPAALIRAELDAYFRGQILALSSLEQLAQEFSVSPGKVEQIVTERLRPHERRRYFAYRALQDVMSGAVSAETLKSILVSVEARYVNRTAPSFCFSAQSSKTKHNHAA